MVVSLNGIKEQRYRKLFLFKALYKHYLDANIMDIISLIILFLFTYVLLNTCFKYSSCMDSFQNEADCILFLKVIYTFKLKL